MNRYISCIIIWKQRKKIRQPATGEGARVTYGLIGEVT
jgi:hypothetical protein